MKRNIKITVWVITAIVLLPVCIIGGALLRNYLYEKFNPMFETTMIFPDDSRRHLADTTFIVNGIEMKMIGVKGGRIDCKGLRKTVELKDFYIGETEVTQELWVSVMGYNPSCHKDSTLCPVENIDLKECLAFVHKLDSISGVNFCIPSHPQWLYAALLDRWDAKTACCDIDSITLDRVGWLKDNSGNTSHPVKQKMPNALGVYDMIGNVSEWTISGSDPLFFIVGGSYETENKCFDIEEYDINHANIKDGSIGLRLVYCPKTPRK